MCRESKRVKFIGNSSPLGGGNTVCELVEKAIRGFPGGLGGHPPYAQPEGDGEAGNRDAAKISSEGSLTMS